MTQTDPRTRTDTDGGDRNRPRLHIHPEAGWLNDPNGLCHVDGTYHVFYQYNPAGPFHDDIHWGHASSPDLIQWCHEPVALRPTPNGPDRGGCWSGCIVDDHGIPTAVYTGIGSGPHDAGVTLARSDRSLRDWQTDTNWRISGPDNPDITLVRDPFVFTFNGRRYAVQGGGGFDASPQLLLYSCDDLDSWRYIGPLLTTADPVAARICEANLWECPNLFQLGGRWVLLLSLWRNDILSGVRYLVGDLTVADDGLRFTASTGGALDDGPDFYAPQVLIEPDRVLLWGWSWESKNRDQRAIDAAGWAGTLTTPRELVLIDGHVVQQPAAEVAQLRVQPLDYNPGMPLHYAAFEVEAPEGLYLDLVDTSSGSWQPAAESALPTRLLVDGSLIELFFDKLPSQTRRAYPNSNRHWIIRSTGPLHIWELGVRTDSH